MPKEIAVRIDGVDSNDLFGVYDAFVSETRVGKNEYRYDDSGDPCIILPGDGRKHDFRCWLEAYLESRGLIYERDQASPDVMTPEQGILDAYALVSTGVR